MSDPVRVYETPEGLRRFSDAAIQHAIDTQLGTLNDGENFAFVATALKSGDTFETKMAVMIKFSEGWSFGGFMAGTVRDPLETVGAEIRFTRGLHD